MEEEKTLTLKLLEKKVNAKIVVLEQKIEKLERELTLVKKASRR